MRRMIAVLFIAALSAATPAFSGIDLIMVEEDGCIYCQRWRAEIGPIYPKTPESACAPLQIMDIGSQELRGMETRYPVRFTPTFLLTDDGKEIARLEGYPGEDFFWGLLGMMLDDHAQNANLASGDPCAGGFVQPS